jgi:peptidyl-prolyl cis-trans isomerase D
MLQTIREHTQGWIAGTIITLIILSFALWGIHSYFVGGGNNSIVAEVNGVEINREQLTVAYERLRRQVQAQRGANSIATAKDESGLKERALKSLIEIELLKQASYKQGFRIGSSQIDGYLQSLPEFQIDGQFSVERFQEVLASTMLSTSEFLELLKTSLMIDQPKVGIVFSSFALSNETDYTIALVNQERDIEYATIPLSYFLAQPFTVTPEQLQTYYAAHQSEFMTAEQASVEYIELSVDQLSASVNPTDAELKNFYSENINSYTLPMSWKLESIDVPVPPDATGEQILNLEKKAQDILTAVKNGADFNKYVDSKAQTLNSREWLTLNKIPPELQKAVADLTTQGQVSGLIKGKNGFVILKVVGLEQPKIQSYEVVKNKVKEAYIRQRAEEKFSELRDQLADMTYEHPESLQYASNKLNLPVLTSDLFERDNAGKGIAQYKKVRDVAFSHDVLALQNNSDVVQLTPESVIVLRTKTHIPARLLPLKDVAGEITSKLKTQQAESKAQHYAEELKASLQTGTELPGNGYRLSWSKPGLIGRYSTKVDTAILDAAFSIPNPALASDKTTYGVTRLTNGYAIIAVKGVKAGTLADAKEAAIFAEQVQNSQGLLEYELYKQSQAAKAKVKIQSV